LIPWNILEVKKAEQGVGTILLTLLKQALGLFDCILRKTIGLRKVGAASNMLKAPFAGKAFDFPTRKLWTMVH